MLRPFPPDLFWSDTWSFGLALWNIVPARLIPVQFVRHHARLRTALRVQCRDFQRLLLIHETCKLTFLYSTNAPSRRSVPGQAPGPLPPNIHVSLARPRSTESLAKQTYTCFPPPQDAGGSRRISFSSCTYPTAVIDASVLSQLYIFPSEGV